MLKTIRQTIKNYNMLTLGDRVLVGLSGGADSVVLLAVLMALREEFGITVCAAHVNHGLRDAAINDEGFARRFCEERGIPFFAFQADVKGLASDEKLSIEEAGRKLRYKYLHQGLAKLGATKIATGHHADDNAETVLLNLFRGAGLKGMCGIPPVNGKIIRPLLEVSRKEIEAYAYENGIPFITDKTNAESDYSRNYIRNKIIPVIQAHFGETVATTMAKNALALRADEDFLETTAKTAFDMLNMQPMDAPTTITLPINELLSHPPALTTRIIRQAIATIRGEEALINIQSTHIKSILDIAQGQTGREASLPGFKALREYENLIFHKHPQNPTQGYSYPLSPGTPIMLYSASITLSLQKPSKNQFDCCTQAFNYDKVEGVLELRTRRAGDKISLSGTGTKKLQDYFTDTKTPKSQREQTLLLADGNNILWIMDKHNRTSAAYKPVQGQQTCWVTVSQV